MALGGNPPGWYADPRQPGSFRWWDGSAWTGHLTSGGSDTLRLDEELRAGSRAQMALLVAVPLFLVSLIGLHAYAAAVADGKSASAAAWVLGPVVAVLVELVVAFFFLVWFHRAAGNALALGLPAGRKPGLATAGFVIPVVNLWWPYQSTRDLLPAGHPARSLVLAWWLLGVVGGVLAYTAVFVAADIGGAVSWVALLLPAVQLTLALSGASQIVAAVADAHRSMAKAVSRA